MNLYSHVIPAFPHDRYRRLCRLSQRKRNVDLNAEFGTMSRD